MAILVWSLTNRSKHFFNIKEINHGITQRLAQGTMPERRLCRRVSSKPSLLYFANKADIEGHNEVADWFETLAKAERSHANRYQKALTELVYQFLLKRINIRRAMWAWFLGWHSYFGSGGQRR
jgi:rubrerythrin